jgi:hypothetical protein
MAASPWWKVETQAVAVRERGRNAPVSPVWFAAGLSITRSFYKMELSRSQGKSAFLRRNEKIRGARKVQAKRGNRD